ncbi:Prenylcysteine lyase-domain-containing protein [Fomitopsis serialis]|uniref:Prenylcysteine lyase-domain-containing protein n=1 Tax=Fomitopsis serialis TaxID=139415 RepID=UPI00200803D1|nr:Prenylcysteine lyase-domain-containing protein [Neoantrodia serialis]KAH9918096.1 Prenylcysteine lyase-domain-containing protein [Neoantrodia serialis]
MRPELLFCLGAALTAQAAALRLPFNIPFFSNDQAPLIDIDALLPASTPPNRVAIIGAGAGGSSAAFWIAKAKERFGLDIEVDVYEKNDYIGGRSTVVYPYNNTEYEAVELGASIFVKVNRNIWRATEEFGLERIGFGDDNNVMGIWDGQEFVLTTGGGSFLGSWMDTLKVIWRYGITAPRRAQAIVKSMFTQFLTLYTPSAPRFSNITALASSLGWTPAIASTTAEYFDTQGIGRLFTRELVDAVTRVNYGQDVDSLHALEGMCSLAAENAASVKGGNFQVFEQFLARSNATVHLKTEVTSLIQDAASGAWLVGTGGTTRSRAYRGVILAAPFYSAAIEVSPPALLAPVPEQPYVHLHVTLLSTTARTPSPAYFGLSGESAPTEVLTTHNRVREGLGPEPEFNSMTYHGKIKKVDGSPIEHDEWVRVEDEWLKNMFGAGNVGWVLRKEWDAYPVLPPTVSFPPIKLAKGLYYVNAFEPFISTMETETIASRNVVDLLLHDEFDASICPAADTADEEAAAAKTQDDQFVLGWDC